MATVKELLRAENDGTLSFGDYTLPTKTKKDNFEFEGDIYKVKTFAEITKLEKNGMFVYESVPYFPVQTRKRTVCSFTSLYREVRLKILKRPMLRLLLQYLHRRMYSSHWNWSRRVSMKY